MAIEYGLGYAWVDTCYIDKTLSVELAVHMFWAAKGQPTRVENQAYCLMGISDVNMSMILQEEILKTTNDTSLFAWRMTNGHAYSRILADYPAAFLDSGKMGSTKISANSEVRSV
ncbi:uncharacterized protein BCR38DRAFT_52668 [Pseudomassariella vexata]|uniref:Heterokaryon incompatibility domain-containing protein n=1 Tax=Pseudomassariella vexata TaxID=1141098 RepID=A0A1Y2DL56_9PEZI|nr:uncharacterized protein BCR38DRAFT_52668 [Pseudomassariella vexata]ORY60038.1 hypothetical protein BCR38DRAFT_52668 [Pseudomassariella vexata]